MLRICRAHEFQTPADEIFIQTGADCKRSLGIEEHPQAQTDHSGSCKRNKIAGDDHPGVPKRATVMVRAAALEECYSKPFFHCVISSAQPDYAAAYNNNGFGRCHAYRMPQQKGSSGF